MNPVCSICGQEWESAGGHVCKAHVSGVVCGEHGPQKFAECPACYENLENAVRLTRIYLRTRTPFTLRALELALKELGDD